MFLFFLLCLVKVNGYSKIFNNWFCIGIKNEIDFTKPYSINIGDLPLVVWKNSANQLVSTVNICKHMGSKLDKGTITNGCLKCPYHGLEMSYEDRFGQTIEHEGKIFWSYKSLGTPFKIPFYNNPNYVKSHLTFDMETSLRDSALNTMDIRHPEFVHKTGFGSSTLPNNIKQYKYNDFRFGLSFDYTPNKLMQQMTGQITNNYNMFIYPNTLWNRVSVKDKHLIISVNLLPLGIKKTRWYITLLHNYCKTDMEIHMMKMFASGILIQDYNQLSNQHIEDALKKEIVFNYKYKNEEVLHWLNDKFQEYEYPDTKMCAELYRDFKT